MGQRGMKLDILKSLNAERAARRAAVVVTDQATGEQRLVKAADVARDPLKDLIDKHVRSGKSGMEGGAGRGPRPRGGRGIRSRTSSISMSAAARAAWRRRRRAKCS